MNTTKHRLTRRQEQILESIRASLRDRGYPLDRAAAREVDGEADLADGRQVVEVAAPLLGRLRC